MSNMLQVATINGVGDFILFLGKLAVAAVCGLISILILRDRTDVNFYVAPVVVISIFAFFIAHVILSLYEVSLNVVSRLQNIFLNRFFLIIDCRRYNILMCM